MTTSLVQLPDREVTNHTSRYLRSPMYISVQQDNSSRTSSLSSLVHADTKPEDISYTQVPTPRDSKYTCSFLPDIRSQTSASMVVDQLASSRSQSCMSNHQPVTLKRSQSFSDYWTNFNSTYFISKHASPQNHHTPRYRRSAGGIQSHSAPVITKTFEETLLPTHNIFFAGRPRTPKVKKVTMKPVVNDTVAPTPLRQERRPRHNRRVTFLDAPHIGSERDSSASMGRDKRSSNRVAIKSTS